MPRRRPGALRAAHARARHFEAIPGLSRSTCHTLNRLDRDELRPDAVAAALRRWQRAARGPTTPTRSNSLAVDARFEPPSRWDGPVRWSEVNSYVDYDCPACAAEARHDDEPGARDVLRAALHALPRRKARELRRLVHHADRRILGNTLPDPQRPQHLPWWRRRIPLR